MKFITSILRTGAEIFTVTAIILLIMLAIVGTATAQSIVTVNQPVVQTTGLTELHLPAGLDCVLIPTKSSRVVIVQHVKVSHPTKYIAIAKFVKTSGAYTLDATSDFMHNRLSFNVKPTKHLFVDGKFAMIAASYTIYVPETMIIRKG